MGEKAARQSQSAAEASEALIDDLSALGEVTAKKMFGGFGIFESGVMFALVDSAGAAFLRMDASNEGRYRDRHGKMPHGLVPGEVLGDADTLLTWAAESLEVARSARKK
ncbi:MAG: TfoX/Sxy family protein [Acidimicrobiia bacterium]|nr:TfoX/Sxy family protein [Acidimicrobiia bacterium]